MSSRADDHGAVLAFEKDAQLEFCGPDAFVDGIPVHIRAAGSDDNGDVIYNVVAIDIPSDIPSLLWREGC
jgi:hypothetical protein